METENYNFENTASEFIDDVKHDVKKINPNERGNTILIEGNIKDMYEFLSNIKNDEIIKQSLHSKYDMMCLNSTIHSLEWGIELELEKNESVTIQLYTDIEITDQLKIYLNKYKTLSFDVTIKSKSENLLDKIILYFKYKNGVEIYSEEFDIFTFLRVLPDQFLTYNKEKEDDGRIIVLLLFLYTQAINLASPGES